MIPTAKIEPGLPVVMTTLGESLRGSVASDRLTSNAKVYHYNRQSGATGALQRQRSLERECYGLMCLLHGAKKGDDDDDYDDDDDDDDKKGTRQLIFPLCLILLMRFWSYNVLYGNFSYRFQKKEKNGNIQRNTVSQFIEWWI